jgi:hypothetical protein
MANRGEFVTEDVRNTLGPGQTVYDVEGKKVGTVDEVDWPTGYMMVESSPFSDRYLYVPVSLITNIDPREMYLSVSKDELRRDHAGPPPSSTSVHVVDGSRVATTTEPSGYDGAPLVVDKARIDDLKKRIRTGYHVYTSDGTDLGTIKEYDAVAGTMLVEKGVFSRHDLLLPVTIVDVVDPYAPEVTLAASQADIERKQHPEMVDVVSLKPEGKEGS